MKELQQLEAALGYQFQDRALLWQALTHRSYLNEHPEEEFDNERLEFLGDAILDFVVGAYLYHRFPELPEGELTALRAALVRTEALAEFARQISLGPALRFGAGEDESGGRAKEANLCAAFEAVIGALYLDQGLAAVEQMMETMIAPAVTHILAQSLHKDAKSEFQVWAQAVHAVTPHYQVIAAEGPDHQKLFTVQVLLEEKVWGVGQGRSKQVAAQAAARKALVQVLETASER